MDKKEQKSDEVSLPSATHSEPRTTLEKQNLITISKVAGGSVDKKSEDVEEVEIDESESDNEEIGVVGSGAVKTDDVNLDDEFEKIVPFKFKKLSEESLDEVDHEIEEILHEAEPLGQEIKTELDPHKAEPSPSPEDTPPTFEPVEVLEAKQEEAVVVEVKPAETVPIVEQKDSIAEQAPPTDSNESKHIEASINDSEPKETLIAAEAVPSSEKRENSVDERPPVPIATYLWEDLKRAKEQGGYPWTHLTKEPLGPDDDPQSILSYKQSPRASRKASNESHGTPKSQKKVRIQDEIEIQETQNYIQDLSDDEDATEVGSTEDNLDSDEAEEIKTDEVAADSKTPSKGILKRSQQILENIKPTTSKFDSGSLKKKIKNPLQKIKKMADQQFKKVKSSRPFVKKIPVSKDEIVLNEDLKILKLKESPKSQHRDIAAYVVKHQDSADSVEIVELERSPNETRKRREEGHVVTPDEVIELPSPGNSEESDRTVESHEISMSGSSSHSVKEETPVAPVAPVKRGHHYEDIDDYISRFTSDGEDVEHVKFEIDPKLQRQDQVAFDDPIFDEFSREMNKTIRRSLSIQDDKMRHELAKRIPKIEELEKQISDEDREEKIIDLPVKMNLALLAPISSIDSTSSDEDQRRQLSIVGEESETSDSLRKKCSFEESVDRDIESLKNDGSDISTTLMEDQLEYLPHKLEATILEEVSKVLPEPEPEVPVENKTTENDVESDVREAAHEAIATAFKEALEKVANDELTKDEQAVKEDVVVKIASETAAAPIKVSERWSKMSDHEYEPIGEPQEAGADTEQTQKRKTSDSGVGAEKKFLRTPTEDSEDNISAQDFQDDIESRFFSQGVQPITDDEAHAVHHENTFDEAVIIDEDPVHRDVPRKRNFMSNAQEQSKSLHKKIKAQASSLKTSLTDKMKKKPKEKPVAVEVAQVNDEPSADVGDQTVTVTETIETVNVQSAEPAAKSKTFKMPNFAKNINIKKATMPKFKKSEATPKIAMPEKASTGRFANFRKLGRSKSMKEESVVGTDSTSFTTPEVSTAEPSKKRFDFGTYPRLIRDKFRRPKIQERSDQSVRSETPPTLDFSNQNETFLQRGPVASRWPEYDSESGKYQQFNSESDLDRESSIERRMRLDYERSTEEREDFEIVKRLMNEEQRQMDEMERENQEIHLMAKAERYKKPFERHESDGYDEDKLTWSGALNKDSVKFEDHDEPNALKFDEVFQFTNEQSNINRSYTPQTNQETQSSGSSARRKGEFDEEDDYFLRDSNRISNEIHIGDYISTAIKEGLSTPEDNALAHMGRYDQYDEKREYTPERPIRSLKRKNKKNAEEAGGRKFDAFYKTYPPKPVRKHKKSIGDDEDEEIDLSVDHEVPDSYQADDLIDDMTDQELFYHQQVLAGLEHPDLVGRDDYDNSQSADYNPSKLPVPPTPPRRRKKKIRGSPATMPRNGNFQNVTAYRTEQKFIPLAQEENFTPIPTPRRTRSRSQMSAHTLDDADSFRHDSIEAFTVFNIQDKENGYAQVRKENPSRPVRRKRSTKSLGDRQFATMPHMKRDSETPPPRPVRNYSTITPNKPPRRKSAGSLVEISQTNKLDDDDYEEIVDNNHENIVKQRLQSGAIVSKMKDRPLPPPPPPKRHHKKQKKDDGDDEKLDKDDGAERVAEPLTIDTNGVELEELEQGHDTKDYLPRQDSDFSEPERVVEVEVSTQTDPVLDEDFVCDEDEDIDIDEFLASDGKMKTLEDILKEEQEAELERARQLAEAENLSRGIQRFRESNQRSFSEKSKASGDRSRSLSRPITPSAVVVERKKSSPIIFHNLEQTMTEAGLFIHPITYDDFGMPPSDEEPHLDEPAEIVAENLDVNNNLDQAVAEALREAESMPTIEIEPATPAIDEIEIRSQNFAPSVAISFPREDSTEMSVEDEELDAEMQRKIEEMIESVMSSAKEEVDWIRSSNEEILLTEEEEQQPEPEVVAFKAEAPEPQLEIPQSQPRRISFEVPVDVVESVESVESLLPEEAPPMPPPRRKSTIDEAAKTETKTESMPTIEERNAEPVTEVFEVPQNISQSHHVAPQTDHQDDRVEESFSSQFPTHLHLSSLDIDNLNVCSLSAGRIVASEIDSNTIVTNELECKTSHNFANTQSIEFPPGFIEEIVERVRCASQMSAAAPPAVESQPQPKESSESQTVEDQPPARPPLPAQFGYPELTSAVPPSFYQLRDFSEDEAQQPNMPKRHRRHHSKRKDSTSEEDFQQREHRSKPRSGGSSGGEPSALALGGQFMRACGNAIRDSGSQLMEILRASSKDESKRDLHIALIILIVIVAGLILMGMGDKSVHHHHWDFFNPPDNNGRP